MNTKNPTEKDIRRIEEDRDMKKFADTLRFIKDNEDTFYTRHLNPSDNPHYDDTSISSFIFTSVTFGSLLYEDDLNEDSSGEPENYIDALKSNGKIGIAETFEFIYDNKEDYMDGKIKPEDIENFEYLFSLVLLESVNFGGDWYIEQILEEE